MEPDIHSKIPVKNEEFPTPQVGAQVPGKSGLWTRLTWLLIVVVIFAADQYTKSLVVENLAENHRIKVIDDLLYITHVQNPGAAFGMFSDLPDGIREMFLTVLGAIALTLVIFYSVRLRVNEWLSQLALHMIFAGAIGNLTDRFIHGSVTDFILFRHGDWSFPAFNIADSAIVSGVFLLLLDTIWPRKKNKEKVAEKNNPAADAVSADSDPDLSGLK